ncbi:SufD family Fe-S cluster assembly protein [Leptospira ognonensis]|nr:SufD family Fe-S cluster assembly protein [Leptospira ognonensis]
MNATVLNQKSTSNFIPESLVSWCKSEAKKHFDLLSYPKISDEIWRKFPLQQLDFAELINNESESNIHGMEDTHFDLKKNSETAKRMLTEMLQMASENYFALYTILQAENFYFYELDKDAKDEMYYDFQYEVSQDRNAFSVILFSVKENCQTKLMETYLSSSLSENQHLLGSISFYKLGSGSKLDILYEEKFDENLVQFRCQVSKQENDSQLNIFSFPSGGFRKKHFYHPELDGKGSSYFLTGVSSLVRRELLDIDAKVTHLASDSTSKIIYKAIVNDKAHHIFTGNLAIPNSVKKVIAHQESHNLSLNKKARAEANPKLEVMAEDVSCTHGATVGDINEEQLFYLLSRGLTPEESKSILVASFYEETINKIPFPDHIKESVSAKIRASVLRN